MAKLFWIKKKFHSAFFWSWGNQIIFNSIKLLWCGLWRAVLTSVHYRIAVSSVTQIRLPCWQPLLLYVRWGCDEGIPVPALPQVLVQALGSLREDRWGARSPSLLSKAAVAAAWHREGTMNSIVCTKQGWSQKTEKPKEHMLSQKSLR